MQEPKSGMTPHRASSGLVLSALVALSGLLGACDSDCMDEVNAAGVFLSDPANLSCQSNADCKVVTTGCHDFPNGLCSQSQLTQAAATSQQWLRLQHDLESCQSSCAVCAAALLPACKDGFCGGAP